MTDLLTPTVNVPAEREKQRRIVNEMREQIANRHRLISLHGVRGFRRLQGAGAIAGALDLDGDHGHQGTQALRMEQGAGTEQTPVPHLGRD